LLLVALPPAERGVHPGEVPAGGHQITFMCDDLTTTIANLRGRGVEFVGEPQDRGFGVTIMMRLPGGVEVMLYEPRHASPLPGVGPGAAG
jgi:hypothetical protein